MDLSRKATDRQIDYVEQLWDLILSVPDEVPIPEWHLKIVRDRISGQTTPQLSEWSEVKQRLQSKYNEY